MATVTVTAAFATLSGLRLTSSTHLRSSTTAGTVVIDTDRFDNLILLGAHTNSSAGYTLTLESDSDFSAQGIGDASWAIATANASIMGLSAEVNICTPVDSARFKSSGGTLIITIPTVGAGTIYIAALKVNAGQSADYTP